VTGGVTQEGHDWRHDAGGARLDVAGRHDGGTPTGGPAVGFKWEYEDARGRQKEKMVRPLLICGGRCHK
jgi:hypothetical protein